jgi:hypothetical protein
MGGYTNKDVSRVFLKEHGNFSRYVAEMQDGKTVPLKRVSTYLNLLAKEALIQWSANMAADHVRGVWIAGQAYTEAEINQHCQAARYAYKEKRDEAAGYGTQAHDIIERFLKEGYWPEGRGWNQLPFEVANSLVLFANWWKEAGLTIVDPERDVERYVYDLKYGYGGTADLLARDKQGRYWLIDWKTGKGIYGSMVLQVAAYYGALWKLGVPMYAAAIVQIGKYDAAPQFYRVPHEKLQKGYAAFCALCRHYDFIKSNDSELAKMTKEHREKTERRLEEARAERAREGGES